jgi:putative aldouronate transport system substrate-binding protein
MENRWHTYGDTMNVSSGIAVTTACADPELAFSFLNAMLDQDIHNLRFWGVEGVDYLVDEDGVFYRTDEIRAMVGDDAYRKKHLCAYGYMPQYGGTSDDGKNANFPNEQPSEFLESLPQPVAKCFEEYGVKSYPGMIASVVEENQAWFPMWSYSNSMTRATKGGAAFEKMNEVKRQWLPMLVMSNDFENDWEDYMKDYEKCDPQAFLDEMQAELNRRAAQ